MNKKKKMLFVFGTRPEAIKMAPLIKAFQQQLDKFNVIVCVTAQHREMLDQVLSFFDITPDFDLNLMKKGQTLSTLTASVLLELASVFEEVKPDYTFVHGDTSTTMSASLAAFYYKNTKLCHIEAGLRTYNKWSPYPEEINRNITGLLTDLHFAPTELAANNLRKEGVEANEILVTGNTVIDALFLTKEIINAPSFQLSKEIKIHDLVSPLDKYILVTAHRRENFGEGIRNICEAIEEITQLHKEIKVVIPVHLNPNIKEVVESFFKNNKNVILIPPQDYVSFVYLMNNSHIILTDSGGVQEEAPSLGKPVILLRDTTERPEALQSGTVIKTGTDKEKIVATVTKLLTSPSFYETLAHRINPYGDGKASIRIVEYFSQLS